MTDRAITRILAPVELSERGEPDLSYVIKLAAQLQAELILVAVIDSAATARFIARHRTVHEGKETFNEILVKDAEVILQQIVDQAAADGVKAWGHATVNEEVEVQILNEALLHKVDLIVVRSHGRSGISKALLGSTAGDIIKAAPCPVLVARI
ncbi:MAG: universal stress protein [Planctomycetota bacterium]|jgi:nucleotide-binding universal stress UspA family protein